MDEKADINKKMESDIKKSMENMYDKIEKRLIISEDLVFEQKEKIKEKIKEMENFIEKNMQQKLPPLEETLK